MKKYNQENGFGNFHLDVTARGRESLDAIVSLLPHRAAAYKQVDGKLVFFWTDDGEVHPLPFPLSGEALAAFIEGWLEHAEYPKEPDTDGSTGKAFHLTNQPCNGPYWRQLLIVEPVWAIFGK